MSGLVGPVVNQALKLRSVPLCHQFYLALIAASAAIRCAAEDQAAA
jgi:hypothetical protein